MKGLILSIQMDGMDISGHNCGGHHWLSLLQWSGTYEAGTREIESKVNMYFKDSTALDTAIEQLQAMRKEWNDEN